MNASLETWRRIEERAGELALIHGGQPTPEDWAHATREQLCLASLGGPSDLMSYIRDTNSDQPPGKSWAGCDVENLQKREALARQGPAPANLAP